MAEEEAVIVKNNKKSPAAFNSSIALLMRIDICRKTAHNCRVERDYQVWLDALASWRSNIYAKLDEAKQKECVNAEKILRDIILNKNPNKSIDIYTLMDEYERLLSVYEDELGLGMIDKPKNQGDDI